MQSSEDAFTQWASSTNVKYS